MPKQGRASRPGGEHGQKRLKCTRKAQDAPTVVVQPRKEGLPQAAPWCEFSCATNRMQLLAAFRDFNFFCVSPRRPPKTLKIVLANSGRSFLTKRGSNGSPSRWNSRSSMRWDKNQCVVALDDKRWQKKIIFNWGFFCDLPGDDAWIHPTASGVKYDSGRHRKVHPDQGREAPEGQIWRTSWQTTSVSHGYKYSPDTSEGGDFCRSLPLRDIWF